jgi:hypothetical protein
VHVYIQWRGIYSLPMALRSAAYRAYALICEHRARDDTDPIAKREWERSAADWNRMEKVLANSGDMLSLIEARPETKPGIFKAVARRRRRAQR